MMPELSVKIRMHAEPHRNASRGDHPQSDEKILLLLFAPQLAVRQQVDAYHGSNLRIARPHATMSEGASWLRFFGRILEESAMLANGLAMIVFTWVRLPTVSSIFGARHSLRKAPGS